MPEIVDQRAILDRRALSSELNLLAERSRDNLPNPDMREDPYIPSNRPAIGDLMDLFKF
jgi:phospholipase C